jgi:hypothetical protein
MPAPGTQFAGPLIVGPSQYPDANGGRGNAGYGQLSQSQVINQNGANNVSVTFRLPPNSQITNIFRDTDVAWDSATSASLTVGTAALGTQYAAALDVKTNAAPRAVYAPTTAQLTAIGNIGNNTDVVATVAVVGATSAGRTRVTVEYVQTVDWQ